MTPPTQSAEDGLLAWIERSIEDGFEDAAVRDYYRVTEDPAAVVPLCERQSAGDVKR